MATTWPSRGQAAYGRNRNRDKAYEEAVLAVDAVALPARVSPHEQAAQPRYGLADLRNQSAQWELALGDTTRNAPMTVEHLVRGAVARPVAACQ